MPTKSVDMAMSESTVLDRKAKDYEIDKATGRVCRNSQEGSTIHVCWPTQSLELQLDIVVHRWVEISASIFASHVIDLCLAWFGEQLDNE